MTILHFGTVKIAIFLDKFYNEKMHSKNLFALVLMMLVLPLPMYAGDGLMWGEKNIRVVQTQWFDIIYSEGSKESAALLAENADRIYREIAEMYGREAQARMPVVLSPKREVFNAYFSAGFYNHIVLYDTAPSQDMRVFSEDLLSTFRHELTHAYTYNMKNAFWTGFDKVFGDAVNPAGLFITSGWAEGATLTSESAGGEGRLNDEYAKHIVKQAKIEGRFPKYDDVQGASDKHPSGAYYHFNGAFNEWLQAKYGMEKYARFWYKCVNFQTISTRLAFKKIYGIKLKDAWHHFENDLQVPDVPPSPLESSAFAICDMFSGSRKTYSPKNNGGAIFSCIAQSENSVAWLEEKSGAIFIASKEDVRKEIPKPKKLFCVDGAQNISLSRDDRFLAVFYVNQQSATYACRVKFYDFQEKKWIHFESGGIADGAIVHYEGASYLVCQQFYSQAKKIAITSLACDNSAGAKGESENASYVEIPLATNVSASDFYDIGNGQFAFVRKNGLERNICIATIWGEILFEQKMPQEKFAIRHLSFDFIANKMYFSYAIPGSMPRLGEFDVASKTFACDKNDISGGIFFPTSIGENELMYIGKFYRQNRLFKLKVRDKNAVLSQGTISSKKQDALSQMTSVNLSQVALSQEDVSQIPKTLLSQHNISQAAGTSLSQINLSQAPTESLSQMPNATLSQLDLPQKNLSQHASSSEDISQAILENSKKYNPLNYFTKGLLLPISFVTSYSLDPRFENYGQTQALPIGITYMTNNPWNSNVFAISAGYSIYTNSVGVSFIASGGTDSSLFKWSVQSQTEFDFAAWKQSLAIGKITSYFPFGKNSAIVFSDAAHIFVGRGNNVYYEFDSKSNVMYAYSGNYEIFPTRTNQRNIFYAENAASLYYSSIHKSGEGLYESAGLAIGAKLLCAGIFDLEGYDLYNDFFANVSPFVEIAIPKLLPISCKDFFVYNLPLTLNLAMFDKTDCFLSASCDAIIFAMDIQKAIPLLSAIFVNRFYFSAGYSLSVLCEPTSFGIAKLGTLAKDMFAGKLARTDYVHLTGTLALTPNFGIFANTAFYTELKFETRYYFNRPRNSKSPWDFLFGISSNFMF